MQILSIFIGIFTLGIIVFIHELGHFLLAKAGGIEVDAFSIGMGKEIIGFSKGNTRYKISMIPFGGYCKMRGEIRMEEDEVKTDDDPHSMYNRPPLIRLFAVAGGPLFNIIFAVLILSLLFLAGFKQREISPVIIVADTVGNEPSPASEQGLQNLDRIISINGETIYSFSDILQQTAVRTGTEINLTYSRNGITNSTVIVPVKDPQYGIGDIGVIPVYLPVVGFVQTNSPAEKAGLKPGDRITAINGTKIEYYYEFQNIVAELPFEDISIRIERDGEEMTLQTTLDRFDSKGYLGISAGELMQYTRTIRSDNPIDALKDGVFETFRIWKETLDGFIALISGRVDAQKNISGPVRIIQFAGLMATQTSFAMFVQFIALLSVALGFFNLLPLPGLDGGHIVFNLFELISRRKIPEKIKIYIETVGFSFLLLLAVFVLFNDLFNLFSGV